LRVGKMHSNKMCFCQQTNFEKWSGSKL